MFSADGSKFVVLARGLSLKPPNLVVYASANWGASNKIEFQVTQDRFALSRDGGLAFGLSVVDRFPAAEIQAVVSVNTQSGEHGLGREALAVLEYDYDAAPFTVAADGGWLAIAAVGPASSTPDDPPFQAELYELPTLKLRAALSVPSQVQALPHASYRPRRLKTAPTSGGSGPSWQRNIPVVNAPPDWSLDDGEAVPRITALVASPDSRSLLVSWRAAEFKAPVTSVIDARTGKLITNLVGDKASVSPSGRWAVVSRPSASFTVYDLHQHRGRVFYDPLCSYAGIPMRPSFSPDEKLVALGGLSFRACLVETATARLRTLLPPGPPSHGPSEDEGVMWPGAWSSDGTALLVGTGAGGMLELLDAKSGRATPLRDQLRSEDPLPALLVKSGGVVRRSSDKSLVVFDGFSFPAVEIIGHQISSFPAAEDEQYTSAALSPDGELFIRGAGSPSAVRSTRDLSQKSALQDGTPAEFRFDPSGRFVYTAEGDSVSVWNVSDGARVLHLPGCPKK